MRLTFLLRHLREFSSKFRRGAGLGLLVLAVSAFSVSGASPPVLSFSYVEQQLYFSTNLAGHSLSPECNPGGGSSCPCSSADVSLSSTATYGMVTSNARHVNTWVNAIGYKPFHEVFPNNQSIRLDQYRYCAQVRLTALPQPNTGQVQNPEAVHLMIQFWDGRNALWNANKQTLEGTIYWALNPWDTTNYGHIKVYVYPLILVDTGIKITPDLNWHQFSLAVDLLNRNYLWLNADGKATNLNSMALAQVSHPDWGTDVSLNITTESMSSYPGTNCQSVFTWTTMFQNASFGFVRQQLAWVSITGTNYYLQYSADLKTWSDLGTAIAGTGSQIVYPGPFCGCISSNVFYRVRLGN